MKRSFTRCRCSPAAFTLIELLTVIVIIAILAVMMFPVLNGVRSRLAKVRCIANLRQLHTAAGLYQQQYNSWPQINPKWITKQPQEYAKSWIEALAPFGVSSKSWICPTTQEGLGAPDYNDPKYRRVDYIATPFDKKPRTAYKWAQQPWFAERSSVHGNGNLLIMLDGSVHELNEYEKKK